MATPHAGRRPDATANEIWQRGAARRDRVFAAIVTIVATAIALLVWVAIGPQAKAAETVPGGDGCVSRPETLAKLADTYHESVRVVALTATGIVIELTAGADGGWTMMATTPQGCTRLLAAGKAVEFPAAVAVGERGA